MSDMSKRDSNLGSPAVTDSVTGTDTNARTKKPYVTPRLEVFGKLTQLTQNTTNASNGDGGATMMVQSDLRLKEQVVRVGTHPLGMGLYLYSYTDAVNRSLPTGRQFGVLAQEVEALLPAAVNIAANGYKQVDYALLGIHICH